MSAILLGVQIVLVLIQMVMNKKYDYLIVGSGLFGATFTYCAKQAGKRRLVIDKRSDVGGNVYSERIKGTVRPWLKEKCCNNGLR